MKDAHNLAKRLTAAREAYYNTDTALMSDAEFDALEDELRTLDPGHAFFSSVGIEGNSGAKIHHRIPMLSMRKAKTLKETEKWLRRLVLPPDEALTVQPKIDGLSATLRYSGGRLDYIATRGDGMVGQDISHIAGHAADIPSAISFTREPVEIRGELHLPRDTAYDTGNRPLRNNCVGLINRKDKSDDLRHVRFLAYQIVWPEAAQGGGSAVPEKMAQGEGRLHSESGKIELLAENSFYTFGTWRLTSDSQEDAIDSLMNKIGEVYGEYVNTLRDCWNYETDGLIVMVDNNRLHDAINERWVVDHHHHYALAFKPPSQSAETVLREVVWQVSRQGHLTPVAVFQPVRLGGALLERASLHNAGNVRRLNLAVEDRILVERANDVIPHVQENLCAGKHEEDFHNSDVWPSACPSCGAGLVESGVNLSCPNTRCRDRELQSILYWVRQADMKQIAIKTLEDLYDAGKLRRISDLYSLKVEDFDEIEGFGEKKAANFVQQAAAAKTMSAVELIARLGIPSVQKKSLSLLGITSMEGFRSFNDDSYAVGRRIMEWKADENNRAFLDALLEVVNIKEEDGASAGSRGVLCLTGKAPLPRKTLISALEERGWTVAGVITRETVKLLCDDDAGKSTKLVRAREAGIEIVTYEDFLAAENILPKKPN